MMTVKLPKQWKHWCRNANLSPSGSHRKLRNWLYLKGHGRLWRVNNKSMLQCGDTYAEFDRWALCDIVEVPQPTSLKEFITAITTLIEQKDTQGVGYEMV